MTLRGSLAEKEMRQQLLLSRNGLLKGENPTLLGAIKEYDPAMKNAFVLNWTPEQGEDIYVVLIDAEKVVTFEISENNKRSSISEELPLGEYLKRNKYKQNRIRIEVALDILSSEMSQKSE